MSGPHAPSLDRALPAQLRLAADRERAVADSVSQALGDVAIAAVAAARDAHPASALDDLESASHDAIARAIAAQLEREASVHAALIAAHGDDAEVRLRLATFEHGLESGRRLAAATAPAGPSAVFDALFESLLEDVPCRSRVRVQSETPTRVRYSHDACPYTAAWSRAGMAAGPGCQLMSTWIRGLVSGLDARVEYRRPASLALGDPRCEHEIVRIES